MCTESVRSVFKYSFTCPVQWIGCSQSSPLSYCFKFMFSLQIFVFDFVNELYLWVGKQSSITLRKRAQVLAREIFDAGCFASLSKLPFSYMII